MRPLNRFVVLAIAVLTAFCFSHAATISGTVKNPDGGPFKGAFVEAQNAKTKVTIDVLSDKEGKYRIESLAAGDYDVKIRAIGYKADPHTGVALAANQKLSFDFALQRGVVRWSDLNLYQGKQLLPDGKGKEILSSHCFVCHGFETRMAATTRDADGWRDRVNYMREAMSFQLGRTFTDEDENDVVTYLSTVFGPDSVVPRSPADLPAYKSLVRTYSDDAMKIVYVEYELPAPTRAAWSAAPDKNGDLWMPYYGRGNKIARLDPQTGEVQEYPVPEQQTAGVHSAVPMADGNVWFTEFALNKIGKFDPATGKISTYADTDADLPGGLRNDKHTIRMDHDGNLWTSGSPLSKFDPKTGKFTHFLEVPSSYGITVAKDGNVWFCVLRKDGKIGRVDPKTDKVTQWSPPTQGTPQRLQITDDGIVWFGERTGNKLGRFDPKTETFKEYDLPGPSASPYALGIDRAGDVWYSSTDQDAIGRLNPATGQVIEYPFPHSENMSREFFFDAQGRLWFASPMNNRVGYLYVSGK
jgi:streptogramin lyase/mono/diheme cytochrome c family protein